MGTTVSLGSVFVPSEELVVRNIEGELIIVPLVSGMGDLEDDLFTLNETGRAIWDRLDGTKTLGGIVKELLEVFDASGKEIEADTLGLVEELLKRGMILEPETE